MRSSAIFTLASALLASSVSAGANSWAQPRDAFCLCDSDAEVIAQDFVDLIASFNQTQAEIVIANDYTDQSDSVNTLIDQGTTSPLALGSLTFSSKDAFIQAQKSQPPIPFQILNMWHTCDTVIIRWVSKQTPQQVQGFDAILVEPASNTALGPYQIKTVYAEFNSGAWLANLGHPECSNATSNATAPH